MRRLTPLSLIGGTAFRNGTHLPLAGRTGLIQNPVRKDVWCGRAEWERHHHTTRAAIPATENNVSV
jgi:hypothetical protein